MQEISSSVRQRLRARPEPQVHPDPDVLTAYIEQALPANERNQVVQHLAECGYCREIISLSLPEPQPEQVPAQVPRRSRSWLPAYRWAAVAATVAIAAALVIEKPWKTSSNRFEQPATVSSPSQPAQSEVASNDSASATQPASTSLRNRAGAALESRSTTPPERLAESTRGTIGFLERDDNLARARRSAAPAAGIAAGVTRNSQVPVAVAPPPPPQPVMAVHQSSAAVPKASPPAGQDYVNPTPLGNQVTEIGIMAPVLPEAPAPKEESAQQYAEKKEKKGPKISEKDLEANSMNFQINEPQTQSAAGGPSGTDSTLAKSGGFGIKSKVHEAVNKTVAKIKKATVGKSEMSEGFTNFAAPSAVSSLRDTDRETDRAATPQFHWSVTPDGRLLRSTDVGQVHVINPFGADLRFRVVEPRGSEVWAGANHGTIIHSWNAGVNWSQFKVPDSNSDITAISIDGDNVQVKTSNGQTFVSNDHGKTWVPLAQPPQ